MAIVIHVFIALTSIAYTTFVFLFPSQTRLRFSYVLIAGTVGSGTYLVVSKQAHLLSTCMTGLVYLGCMTAALLAARYRLAAQKVRVADKLQ